MKVIFFDKYENRRQVKEVDTLNEGYKAIYEFLKGYNYEAPYKRMWREENEIWVDVGSHTEFFIIEAENAELAERSIKEWIEQSR